MKNKQRYFITGVSDVDPFTQISFKPTVELRNKEGNVIDKILSEKIYIDGSMMNILRKHIQCNEPITDIYIYLTERMSKLKDVYEKSIKHLYNECSNIDVNINFYPNDFVKDEIKLRNSDVHKFASYYKEIYEIYSKIKEMDISQKPEIIINISSGTPAFKADMMLMAVTNNLIIEQTSNIISEENKNEILNVAERLNDKKYKELISNLQNIPENNQVINISSEKFDTSKFSEISDNELNTILNYLNTTEKEIKNRTNTEDISQTKKVMLLESIEDSINKKDYCGIYHTIEDNKEYLGKNRDKLIEIGKNLYYRYIGNEKKALENEDKLKEYYPIFNINFNKDEKEKIEAQKSLNNLIEKFNILKIKSKREEINDWLLITTPLVETIFQEIAEKESKIIFEDILERAENGKNKGKKVLSLDKFNNLYKNNNDIIITYKETIKEYNGEFLNASFYRKILRNKKNDNNIYEQNKLNGLLNKLNVIDQARSNRVDAAHSIKNVSKEEFTIEYFMNLEEKFKKIKWLLEQIKNEANLNKVPKEDSAIYLVEKNFYDLIKMLLPNTQPITLKYFEDSLNKYETLEKEIINLLKEEIYN